MTDGQGGHRMLAGRTIEAAQAAHHLGAEALTPAPRARPEIRALAGFLVLLSALQITIVSGVTVGLVAALVLTPVWLPSLRRYSGAAPFFAMVLLALCSGLWLTEQASADHATGSHHVTLWVTLMLSLAATVGVIVWARTVLRDGTVAVLYGTGLLGSSLLFALDSSNPWKTDFSLPLTVLLLGLAWVWRARWLELLLALSLATVSALNDSRSHFAMVVLAAALVLWQMWVRPGRRRGSSTAGAVIVLAGLGWAIYSFGQALILEGYLGAETQARSQAQVEATGSILLGSRPELAATTALMQHRPQGFGFGTLPSGEDIGVAKTGMASLNYDPNNGYVEDYMFGGYVKLHSLVGDMWAMFGFAGLVLSSVLAWIVLRRVVNDLPARGLNAVVAFLAARVLWDLFFGPLFSALTIIALTVGLAVLPKDGRRRHASGRSASPTRVRGSHARAVTG